MSPLWNKEFQLCWNVGRSYASSFFYQIKRTLEVARKGIKKCFCYSVYDVYYCIYDAWIDEQVKGWFPRWCNHQWRAQGVWVLSQRNDKQGPKVHDVPQVFASLRCYEALAWTCSWNQAQSPARLRTICAWWRDDWRGSSANWARVVRRYSRCRWGAQLLHEPSVKATI